jgi:predicted transcriptional regulator of viral defense system
MQGNAGDRAALAIAAGRHGIITTAQLRAAGLTRHAIAHRVASEWLRPLHRGVFLVGPVRGPWSLEAGALAACGAGTVISHHSAGALWGMRAQEDGPVHVSVAATRDPRHVGIHVHRVQNLAPGETTRRHDLAVTTPVRTLLDLAMTVPIEDLERAVNEALVTKVATRNGLLASLARCASHRGAGRLRAALMDDSGITRSEAELALKRLIRRSRIPPPRTNVKVAGYEVDCHWPELGLVVEVDGAGFHGTPRAFQTDRDKEAALHAAGKRLIRVTRWEAVRRPEATIARLATATAVAASTGVAAATPGVATPAATAARPP